MTGVTRLELALLAGFILITLALGAIWRSGYIGGFVVVVGATASLTWAIWLGWRPALTRLSRTRGTAPGHGDDLDFGQVAA